MNCTTVSSIMSVELEDISKDTPEIQNEFEKQTVTKNYIQG